MSPVYSLFAQKERKKKSAHQSKNPFNPFIPKLFLVGLMPGTGLPG